MSHPYRVSILDAAARELAHLDKPVNKGIMVAVQVSLICNAILFIIKPFALPEMT